MFDLLGRRSFTLLLALLCASCGRSDSSSSVSAAGAVPDTVAVSSPSPSTAALAASSTVTGTTGINGAELASIASNFDIASLLQPASGTGAIPPSGAPDVVGSFRFLCNVSHLAYDDPILYPGQPGKSHLHQFFGNTLADANSTYASLRTTGDSTCGNALNRSAYWTPAMLDGKGGVVKPDYIMIYYKRRPSTDPYCQKMGVACVNIPRGLRYVFGYDMLNTAAAPTGAAYFNCDGPSAVAGHYPDIVAAAANCPVGNRLGAVIMAPDCWDGKNLDSPDHRSHVAYASYGDWGYLKCDAAHPYVLPQFFMGVWYTVDGNLDRSGSWSPSTSTWHLSSDEMPGMMMRPGSTFHSDWFGAWDDNILAQWSSNCIDKLLSCNSGDLGNGKQLTPFAGFTMNANPRVVPVPARPL